MEPTNLGIACGENIIIPADAIFSPLVNPGAVSVPLCVGETLDRGEGTRFGVSNAEGETSPLYIYIYIFGIIEGTKVLSLEPTPAR